MEEFINHTREEYKPSKDEKYMNKKQLDYFKQKLYSWKEELLKFSNKTLKTLKESSTNANDPNDIMISDLNVDLELKNKTRYKNLIHKIDAALDRIKKGQYGYCLKTGAQIGLDRLEARPIAILCIEAQQEQEMHEKLYQLE